MIRQVDDIMCSAAALAECIAVLDIITKTVTFKLSEDITSLFYATDIE
jgi:hypothetical protein